MRFLILSSYLNKFGNVDVDWQLNLNRVINDFNKANIASHQGYDDDAKIKKDINNYGVLETLGSWIQFKQLLGVRMVYVLIL